MAIIKGVWVFNETPDTSDYLPQEVLVNFTSNTQSFLGFHCDHGPFDYIHKIKEVDIGGGEIVKNYDTTMFYTGDSWNDGAYKTIDFGEAEQTVDDDFYAWFTANAAQIEETTVYVIQKDALVSIASAIREKLGTTDKYTPAEMPEAIRSFDEEKYYQQGFNEGEKIGYDKGFDEGYEDGREIGYNDGYGVGETKGYDKGYKDGGEIGYNDGYNVGETNGYKNGIADEKKNFMNNYQQSLNGNYECAFYNAGWNDTSYNPVVDIVATRSAVNMFKLSAITNTKKNIYLNCSNANSMFVNAKNLTTIPHISFGEELTNTDTFTNGASNLEEITVIEGTINTSMSFSSCKKLNVATLERIKNALADRRGESTTTKLTINETFQPLFEANGWIDEITNKETGKNWTLAFGT